MVKGLIVDQLLAGSIPVSHPKHNMLIYVSWRGNPTVGDGNSLLKSRSQKDLRVRPPLPPLGTRIEVVSSSEMVNTLAARPVYPGSNPGM